MGGVVGAFHPTSVVREMFRAAGEPKGGGNRDEETAQSPPHLYPTGGWGVERMRNCNDPPTGGGDGGGYTCVMCATKDTRERSGKIRRKKTE